MPFFNSKGSSRACWARSQGDFEQVSSHLDAFTVRRNNDIWRLWEIISDEFAQRCGNFGLFGYTRNEHKIFHDQSPAREVCAGKLGASIAAFARENGGSVLAFAFSFYSARLVGKMGGRFWLPA
jgi:hypothetical protein